MRESMSEPPLIEANRIKPSQKKGIRFYSVYEKKTLTDERCGGIMPQQYTPTELSVEEEGVEFMTLNMKFSQECGDFRVSAFGLDFEVAHVEGQNEIVISKVDGCVHFALRDITDASDESAVSDDVSVTEEVLGVGKESKVSDEANQSEGVVINETIHDVAKDDAVTLKALTDEAQAELFTRLSALRKRLAVEQGKPPYIIFHDSTLRDIAREFPMDLKSLSKINGVGRVKLKRYGGLLLEAIHEYKGVTMAG
jgi:hypothetical protein